MSNIKSSIIKKLHETEQNYEVKIPFAIESGSRGWGFASPDSDYDCRFIYVHKKDWYISILKKRDVIEYAADAIYDVNGWDLKKVLEHIIRSNAVMLEWLSSNVIYISNDDVVRKLQVLGENFFNPIAVSYHYLYIAKNKLREILSGEEAKLKKYFYILRPVANLNYIYQYGKMPYMEYDTTLSKIETAPNILKVIHDLQKKKVIANESFKIKRNQVLIDYFQNEIGLFEDRLQKMKFQKNKNYEQADSVFKIIIEMVWQNE